MTITSVPTRTIGSLGPTKANRRAAIDPYKQISAEEYNLLADCACFLVDTVGVESGYASDSIQGRLDTLEAGSTESDYEYGLFRYDLSCAAGDGHWNSGGLSDPEADPALDVAPGCFKFVQNDDKLMQWAGGANFPNACYPRLEFRFRITFLQPETPKAAFAYFVDDGGTEGFGVALDISAGGVGAFYGYTMTGSVKTYSAASTVALVADEWYRIACWLDEDDSGDCHVSFYRYSNATSQEIDCGAPPFGKQFGPAFLSINTATAAEYWYLSLIRFRADLRANFT